jgi:hypothetical protein
MFNVFLPVKHVVRTWNLVYHVAMIQFRISLWASWVQLVWKPVLLECSLTIRISAHFVPANVKSVAYLPICAQSAIQTPHTTLLTKLLLLVSVPVQQAPTKTQINVYLAYHPASPAHQLLSAAHACPPQIQHFTFNLQQTLAWRNVSPTS